MRRAGRPQNARVRVAQCITASRACARIRPARIHAYSHRRCISRSSTPPGCSAQHVVGGLRRCRASSARAVTSRPSPASPSARAHQVGGGRALATGAASPGAIHSRRRARSLKPAVAGSVRQHPCPHYLSPGSTLRVALPKVIGYPRLAQTRKPSSITTTFVTPAFFSSSATSSDAACGQPQ